MAGDYRSTGDMFVCAPTNHLKDIETLERIIKEYKALGGKLPSNVEPALETAKTAKNFEDSMNIACDGLFKFYVSEQVRCAKEAGFSSLDQYNTRRRMDDTDPSVLRHEDCVLRVERKWAQTNIDYTINPYNKESLVRSFLKKTMDQVLALTGKWVKKKAVKAVEQKTPRYESPPKGPPIPGPT